jgi:hypothetical protein
VPSATATSDTTRALASGPRTAPSTPPSTVASMVEVLGPAIAAGVQAEHGNTSCEKAKNSTLAMLAYYNKTGALDEKRFMAGCESLPPEMQVCFVLSYAREHLAECTARKMQVPPDVMQKAEAAMAGK